MKHKPVPSHFKGGEKKETEQIRKHCYILLSCLKYSFQGMLLIIVSDLLTDVLSLAFTVKYYFYWE